MSFFEQPILNSPYAPPQGRLQIIDISNAPFARPDLDGLLNGLKFIQEKDYPIRGTAA